MKGYSSDLYILAFDHRGTLTKGLLGVEGRPPSSDEVARVSSMKDIIFDGFLEAQNKGINGGDPAILVDETFGLQVQGKAKEMGITPEELINDVLNDHKETYDLYGIKFTNFYTTHSEENKKYSEKIYLEAKKNNLISKEIVEQLYDENEQMLYYFCVNVL